MIVYGWFGGAGFVDEFRMGISLEAWSPVVFHELGTDESQSGVRL